MFTPVNKLILMTPYVYGVIGTGYTVVRQLITNAVSPTWNIDILDYGGLSPSEISISIDGSNNIVVTGTPTTEALIQYKIRVTDFMGRSMEKTSSIVTSSSYQSYQTVISTTTTNVPFTSDQGRFVFQTVGTWTLTFSTDRYLRAFAIGGGGSGSCGSHYNGFYAYLNRRSSGGSSGSIDSTKQWFKVTKNTPVTIVVGAGGDYATTYLSGNNGNPSSITYGGKTILNAAGGQYGVPGGDGVYTPGMYTSYSSGGWSPGQNLFYNLDNPYQGGVNGLNCGFIADDNYTMMGSQEDIFDTWDYLNTFMYPATSVTNQVSSLGTNRTVPYNFRGAGFGAGGQGTRDKTDGYVAAQYLGGGNGANGIDIPISGTTFLSAANYETSGGYGNPGTQGFVLVEWN